MESGLYRVCLAFIQFLFHNFHFFHTIVAFSIEVTLLSLRCRMSRIQRIFITENSVIVCLLRGVVGNSYYDFIQSGKARVQILLNANNLKNNQY